MNLWMTLLSYLPYFLKVAAAADDDCDEEWVIFTIKNSNINI